MHVLGDTYAHERHADNPENRRAIPDFALSLEVSRRTAFFFASGNKRA